MEGQDKKYLAWGLYISAESQIFPIRFDLIS